MQLVSYALPDGFSPPVTTVDSPYGNILVDEARWLANLANRTIEQKVAKLAGVTFKGPVPGVQISDSETLGSAPFPFALLALGGVAVVVLIMVLK